jgi:universal stress protein A
MMESNEGLMVNHVSPHYPWKSRVGAVEALIMERILPGALLVATDLSDVSVPAAIYAADLAQRTGAPIVLLHVVSPKTVAESVAEGRYADIYLSDLRGNLYWWFTKYVPPAARARVNVMAMATVGQPEHEIPTLAHAIKPRMIVMSTHGRAGLARAVLGSVAEAVLRHAPCPVLAIPPGAVDAVSAVPGGAPDQRVTASRKGQPR